MGIYSDNFYSWMDREFAAEKAAMDANPNGWKHPDGTPCRAKSPETCPKFAKEKHALIDQDALDPVANVQLHSSAKEFEAIRKGDDPETKNVRAVRRDECTTMGVGSTKSKYREKRNEAFANLLKYASKGKDISGSYPLDNPTQKVTHINDKGEEVDGFADGWQVSFQTTNGEGFNKRADNGAFLSDEDYDKTVERLIKETGSKPYLGVFGNIPEISFRCDSFAQAKAIAQEFNQVSIANNKRIAANIFDRYTFPKNKKYDWMRNQTFVMA